VGVAGRPRSAPKRVGSNLILETALPDPAAFDAVAASYDADFSQTALGRILRKRVWRHLRRCFSPGQHVLELACGTGEDAVWLAVRGIRVTATDGSGKMIRIVQDKASHQGLSDFLNPQILSLQAIVNGKNPLAGQQFDGAFSNFGGINNIGDWRSLAKGLASLVRPGGRLVLVPMGPFCPWEILWHLVHGQPREAFRRFGHSPSARIGGSVIPIWYPSPDHLRHDFAPWFKQNYVESLGLWLPPTNLGQLLARWPGFWVGLSGLEAATARFSKGAGDHYIMALERI
jgi:ubiquinone/menaquinone biosynthesis C-methylase UbiE